MVKAYILINLQVMNIKIIENNPLIILNSIEI